MAPFCVNSLTLYAASDSSASGYWSPPLIPTLAAIARRFNVPSHKQAKSCLANGSSSPNRSAIRASAYFIDKVQRMQHGTFRSRGFFIGSGVIEAGCKTIIGSRCKQSGIFWSVPGAENILALCCIRASRRLDQFWKVRLNAHAASNDCLALAA